MNTSTIMLVGREAVRLDTGELPALAPGESLVKVDFSAVSTGTELANFLQKPSTSSQFPRPLGYSTFGVCDGQRVVAECPHSRYANVPATRCVPVPTEISGEDAAAYRLASIALQGIRKAQIQIGDTVVVVGLGPIGNLAAQFARIAGARTVVGIDPLAWRCELAKSVGAIDISAASIQELNQTFDVVIEATGNPSVIPDSLRLARRLGKVVLLGSPRGATANVDFYTVHAQGLVVVGAHEGRRPQFDELDAWRTQRTDDETVLHFLSQKRIQVRPLISEIAHPRDAQRVYERLRDGHEKLMLVVFDWRTLGD